MDNLYLAAEAWQKLLHYSYHFVFVRRKNTYDLMLSFEKTEFYHLAGFQYLKDCPLQNRFSKGKTLDKVLGGEITEEMLKKSKNYESMILPRLLAICQLQSVLDNGFESYHIREDHYPFYTEIHASFLFCGGNPNLLFFFTDKEDESQNLFSKSIFMMDGRDYRLNQSKLNLLLAERITLSGKEITELFRHPKYQNTDQSASASAALAGSC